MSHPAASAPMSSRSETLVVGLLFVGSGAAALIYEVLWLKQLGLLFGNTAQAAAATLSVFFLGLSVGARAWGGRAARTAQPLVMYARLEVAIAASALLYFALFDLYAAIYPRLAVSLYDSPVAFVATKLLLVAGILFPPAFFMGGTLPFMSEHLMRRRANLGATFSWLYACNTIGGAAGAFAAAFLLPSALGFTRSYAVAIGLSLGAAVLAAVLSRRTRLEPAVPRASSAPADLEVQSESSLAAAALAPVAFFSGAATLGLEVLWTRMFAQVLHNSVYSFAAILVTFLVSLAVGAAVAHRLCRLRQDPAIILNALLIAAGVSSGLSPWLFYRVTDGLHYLAPHSGWWGYILAIFGTAATVMLVPGIAMGTVFPYLLRSSGSRRGDDAGRVVGRLTSWNTLGSICGSLLCGFLLIEWLGLWASIRSIALAYLGLAVFLMPSAARYLRVAIVVVLAVVTILLDPARLPLVLSAHDNEFVRETWETGQAIVAVTEANNDLLLKIDNYYSLGGTSARTYEETQADVPLILHPAPRQVLLLGMGSGITAGAALRHRVEALTVCEIVPAVVEAARRHFKPYINGLFEDERARVIVADGRQHLLATAERYDVILADLFIPWQVGAGSLYSREHFRLARSRLRPGGLFVQWLPLYQLSKRDALVIIRTLLDEFPQVTMWRGDFLPEQPIVALIGQDAGATLDPQAITESFRHRRKSSELPRRLAVAFSALFYAGNLTANRDLFASAGINTDDRPLIEYLTPIAQREHLGDAQGWFTGAPLADFQSEILKRVPPEQDPYLARLDADERDFARGGLDLFRAVLHKRGGRDDEARQHAEAFARHVPAEVYTLFKKDVEGTAPSREKRSP